MLNEKDIILEVKSGSYAYGTNTPESDEDYRGIMIHEVSSYLGCVSNKEQYEFKSPHDRTIYDIQKYMRLAADINPSILETLFTRDEDIVSCTKTGELLRENRDMFLSKACKQSYSGYARHQIHKVKTHRGWLLNPPKKKPERSDYGLPDHKRLIPKDWIEALASSDYSPGEANEDAILFSTSEELIAAAKKEKAYKDAMKHWDSYIHWKEERNPKRAALEARYGYDTKHMHHCTRLLLQGNEILEGKGLIVYRQDREYLKSIRAGKYTYEEMIEETERLSKRMEELYDACDYLPEISNINEINELCIKLILMKLIGDDNV